MVTTAIIPAPTVSAVDVGPLTIHLYALCLLLGAVVAYFITKRRWTSVGGDPSLVLEVALWSGLAGVVGARAHHVATSWDQLGDEWYAPFAVWKGGLGIWGGVAAGVIVGALVVRLRSADVGLMMDAAAPALLVAQGIGRLGNYFNQELYGAPTSLWWGLAVDPARRPDGLEDIATFHPTFLYEMLWNFAGAVLLVWLGRRFRIAPPGLFCLYVAIYSAGRLIWEQLRIDPSMQFLGQRLNFYVALALLLGSLCAFAWSQSRSRSRPDSTRLERTS
jgi:prolipoprotein diacylglyceryl transferase